MEIKGNRKLFCVSGHSQFFCRKKLSPSESFDFSTVVSKLFDFLDNYAGKLKFLGSIEITDLVNFLCTSGYAQFL